MKAWLRFLGPSIVSPATAPAQLIVPANLTVGARLFLELRHPERWSRTDVTRVIIGSDRAVADVHLADEPLSVQPEHARFYLNHQSPDASDFRAMKNSSVSINGQVRAPLQWINLKNGDELQLGTWRFRYEWQTDDSVARQQ